MTDREFDLLLYQSANQLPPDDETCRTTDPWRAALIRICWGLGLNFFTLQFWNLQYILPSVGIILVYLGFRTLRRENGWFRLGHRLSILLLAMDFALDILLATPLAERLGGGGELLSGLAVGLVVWLLQFALWRGLKQVFRKAGQPPKTRAAGGLVIWYGIVCAVALLGETGGYIALFLAIVWIVMLLGLFQISRSLDEAGYAIQPAPVRFSNGRVMLAGLLGVSAAIFLCLFLFSRYPVNASLAQAETGHAELRAELAELGFPEDLLADLTDEEAAAFEGARSIDVVHAYGMSSLAITQVQVCFDSGLVRYADYFTWSEPPAVRLKDGLEIVPIVDPSNGLKLVSEPSGRLLWTEDGTAMSAALLVQHRAYGSFYWGRNTDSTAYYLEFSLPRRGEALRGYVIWTADASQVQTPLNFNVPCTYIHQASRLCYPYQSPYGYSQSGSYSFSDRPYSAYQHWLETRLQPPGEISS